MQGRPSSIWRGAVVAAVAVACLLAVWSVAEGWQWSLGRLTSTGCEEEALFPIWKAATGQAVYADADQMPFSASYYNWLFYAVYGGVVRGVLAVTHLGTDALPAIARMITVGFSAACVAMIYLLLQTLKPGGLAGSRFGRLACSVFLMVNPLTGPWLYTARPDLAALLCELIGLWFALRHVRDGNRGHLVLAVAAGLLAWSFKQNFVHLLGGLCVFFLLRRQWKDLLAVTAISVVVASGTLWIGGGAYRHALIGAQLNCQVSAESAWMLFQQATANAPQLVALAAGLIIILLLRTRWRPAPAVELLAAVSLVAFGIGFLGISKQGADTNYFIPASVLAMIWCLSLHREDTSWPVEARRGVNFLHWSGVAAACVAVAAGLWPQISRSSEAVTRIVHARSVEAKPAALASELDILKRHLRELPGPIFVTDRACNLPWIQPKAPHFVYSFMYALDKKSGHSVEGGGIGGLIEAGYFETVVVLDRDCACESPEREAKQCSHVTMNHLPMVRDGPVPSIDGGRMTRYAFAFQDGLFQYYRKRGK